MNIRKHIPNTITCLSLLSGCAAIVTADWYDKLYIPVICILVASVFDFLDGFFARLLHAYSSFGKELDSLSDLVSFGVAPGMIIYHQLGMASAIGGIPVSMRIIIQSLAFVIPVCSALRLAKFNLDSRQTESFLGLPVPAHALFWASLGYALQPVFLQENVWVLVALVVSVFLTSLMLVSEIPMLSMKVKSYGWKGNEVRYILGACGICFVAFGGILGIAATIFLYVLLSIFNKK
jgi:CDP-diacylglycerol--serine O-phosphatidyltransferase